MTHPPLEEVLTSRSARQAYRQAQWKIANEGWIPALGALTLAAEQQARANSHDWIKGTSR